MGEEKDPQHLFNEVFFLGKAATCAAGEPSQGTWIPKGTPAAQGWQKNLQRGKLALAGAAPVPLGWKHSWGGVDPQGKLVRNCFGGTGRSGTSRAAAGQVKQQRSGISLWRLLFTYAKVILSEEAIGMYSFRAGNATLSITPSIGTRGVSVAGSWRGGCWGQALPRALLQDIDFFPVPGLPRMLGSQPSTATYWDGRILCGTKIKDIGVFFLETQVTVFCMASLQSALKSWLDLGHRQGVRNNLWTAKLWLPCCMYRIALVVHQGYTLQMMLKSRRGQRERHF